MLPSLLRARYMSKAELQLNEHSNQVSGMVGGSVSMKLACSELTDRVYLLSARDGINSFSSTAKQESNTNTDCEPRWHWSSAMPRVHCPSLNVLAQGSRWTVLIILPSTHLYPSDMCILNDKDEVWSGPIQVCWGPQRALCNRDCDFHTEKKWTASHRTMCPPVLVFSLPSLFFFSSSFLFCLSSYS